MYLFLTALHCTISIRTLLDYLYFTFSLHACKSSPRTSVRNIKDLRTCGRQFNLQISEIVIVTGFSPLSLLSIVSTMNIWESSHWFEKNICRLLIKIIPEKHGKCPLAVGI